MTLSSNFSFSADRIKDAVILSLRSFFRQNQEFPWSEDDEQTSIQIADKYSIKLIEATKKPTISIQRGPLVFSDQSLNNSMVTSNLAGRDKHIFYATVMVVILCVSRSGLEAERLSGYVAGVFRFFRDEIRSKALFDVRGVVVGEERVMKADADIDLSVVPVSLNIEYTESVEIVEVGNILGDFEVRKS